MATKKFIKFNADDIKIKEKSLTEHLLSDDKCLDDRYLNLSGSTLKGDISLDQGSTYSIGSEDKKLKALYADEVHISQNTLYINETPVLGTESDTITVKADVDQSVLMKTSGIGVSQITSEKGVDIITKGNNSNVTLTADGTNSSINLSATKNINITGESISIDGNTTIKNLNVTGTTTTVNSTDLSVKDNIIEINAGETGNGVSKGTAGIKINRGDELPYLIEFDETEDMFKVGMQGDLETIASQDYVNNIANKIKDPLIAGKIQRDTDDSGLSLIGATKEDYGARLDLTGKDSQHGGAFGLWTSGEEDGYGIYGSVAGDLKWEPKINKGISYSLVDAGIVAQSLGVNGYIKYGNGRMDQWMKVNMSGVTKANIGNGYYEYWKVVTYPVAFKEVLHVQNGTCDVSNQCMVEHSFVGNISSTQLNVGFSSLKNGDGAEVNVFVYVIGTWK